MSPIPTAIPSKTIMTGPTMVNGRPRIHKEEARNEIASPWAMVVNIANHVHGREDHSSGVVIAPNSPRRIPKDIPKTIGVRISNA